MSCWSALLAVALLSQGPSVAAAPGPPFTGVSGTFFALSVADADASARWYHEKLGLTVVMREPKQNKASVIVLEGGGLMVELVQHDDAIIAPMETPLLHGFFKAGVIVDDLDRTLAILKTRGVPTFLGPYPARGKIRSNALIKDNAGNLIQFFGK